MSELQIEQIPCLADNYGYLIHDADAGLTATIDTPDAEAIAAEVEDCAVGAGTVLNAGQLEQAVEAGAKFMVSPGASPDLVRAAADAPVPFLPGIATAGEAMPTWLRTASSSIPVLRPFPPRNRAFRLWRSASTLDKNPACGFAMP